MAFENQLYPVFLPVPQARPPLKGPERIRILRDHARRALAISAQKSGVQLEKLEKAKNGAPIPSNGVFWSLSHKESFVGAVVAPEPVGIDVERIRSRSKALFSKIADNTEWKLTTGDRTIRFFRYWTAKEAVLKAVGDGLLGLSRCRIQAVFDENRLSVGYREKVWEVEQHFFQGHLASIACGFFPIDWIIIEEAFPEP